MLKEYFDIKLVFINQLSIKIPFQIVNLNVVIKP